MGPYPLIRAQYSPAHPHAFCVTITNDSGARRRHMCTTTTGYGRVLSEDEAQQHFAWFGQKVYALALRVLSRHDRMRHR